MHHSNNSIRSSCPPIIIASSCLVEHHLVNLLFSLLFCWIEQHTIRQFDNSTIRQIDNCRFVCLLGIWQQRCNAKLSKQANFVDSLSLFSLSYTISIQYCHESDARWFQCPSFHYFSLLIIIITRYSQSHLCHSPTNSISISLKLQWFSWIALPIIY